ncbi:2-oxoacid:acceptor oxidoreductase subunit alpha, partial [Chloroflexota bacterium]
GVLGDHFGGGKVVEKNLKAAQAGFDYVKKNHRGRFRRRLRPVGATRRMLLTGNEAMALGAIAAGCKFMSAYPMTPASSIMEYLVSKEKDLDLVMVHAEDEIAAVNMAIGAGFAGVRAMTATSGSGFCLMVEGLGLAGITETPVVIIDAQRPGPAVGLPTRTEQGDLQFVLHAHHGEFPRAVLAPASIEDAFGVTVKAFNIAEKYQLPVIILTDQHLASSYTTVDRFDLAKVAIDRGSLYSPEQGKEADYRRHQVTRDGISPRAFPGMSKALVVTDGDEHDETGHLTEDARIRAAQVEKRMRKLVGLSREITPPRRYGPAKAETTLIGWGSTWGALREATDILRRGGASINLLHLNELWPFPAKAVARIMDKAERCYVVESNATGQLARLIRAETGKKASGQVLKYDGRPLTPAYIVAAVKKEGR